MKARFTGHDTFPLRYGWLYKAVNYLNSNKKLQTTKDIDAQTAIVELGVGKNMVNAIRYWAESASLLTVQRTQSSTDYSTSLNGNYLFNYQDGKDPYLERQGSIWLVHFWLNFNFEHLTAYRYFFNFSHVQHFEKTRLVDMCCDESIQLTTNDTGSESTIKKDIDCFLSSYCKRFKGNAAKKKNQIDEDYFTSPLAELNLINDLGNGFYKSEICERPEIPIEIFIYALSRFAQVENKDSNINTLDFDKLLTKPCSPGRIFRLSERGLGQKLDEAQNYSSSGISWIDSLGLRQIKIDDSYISSPEAILDQYYGKV